MYGALGLAPGRGDRLGDRQAQREERRQEIEAERQAARAMFPDLPIPEARKRYAQYEAGRKEAQTIQREYWPILAAIGAGLLVMTFLGKKRRR